jgi:hypothetical protein
MERLKRKRNPQHRLPTGAPDTELNRLLCVGPRPLIDPRKRLIVIFSPKSACTSVVIWFLHQLGHTNAAQDYARLPHKYRVHVYYKSKLYRQAFKEDLSTYSMIRVVRDPFERAVSSFRHIHRNGSADELIAGVLKRNITTEGLSFSEFLDLLEACDLNTCDSHYRIQRHPLEDRLSARYLINASAEDLFQRLNQIEADLKLAITDFGALEWLHSVDVAHSHKTAASPPADAYTRRFSREDALSGSWPTYAAFLTPEARERIARLYATDIQAYGTSPTRPRARQSANSEQDSSLLPA